ncbi:sigma-70 family RNA polymerase sigma factor [Aeoliella sp. SH292]|uniref:sigma-70 family RNA polymerase sigma factor n=1 Tax=Aeoliella sp. SH292 TaxID=3454464 RepID=UPI003F9BB30A
MAHLTNQPPSLTSPSPKDRLEQLKARRIAFIANRRFQDAPATSEIELVVRIERGDEDDDSGGGQGLPPHLRRLCSTPLLSMEEEQEFFFRLNYCKFHAAAVLATIHPTRPSKAKLDEAEDYLLRSDRLRNYLLKANTRLVMSIARKFADARNPFDDLLSSGLSLLVRAVEKFDCQRGYRFSTYATCAVRRELHRMVANGRRDSLRFAAVTSDVLDSVPDVEVEHPGRAEARWEALSRVLSSMMEVLDEREQQIIRARFGFDDDESKNSFSHLGQRMGISKERVRQLANRALEKLRDRDEMAMLEAYC